MLRWKTGWPFMQLYGCLTLHIRHALRDHPYIDLTLCKCKTASISTHFDPLTPLHMNKYFPPGKKLRYLTSWFKEGPPMVKHFVANLLMVTVYQAGQLGATSWEFHQIQHFIEGSPYRVEFIRDCTEFEELCTLGGPAQHSLSKPYTMLQDPPDPVKPPFIVMWENALQTSLSQSQWQMGCKNIHKGWLSVKLQKAKYKLLSRWYLTPSRLHKMYLPTSPLCWWCQEQTGPLLHIWWECKKIQKYWMEVIDILPKINRAWDTTRPLILPPEDKGRSF